MTRDWHLAVLIVCVCAVPIHAQQQPEDPIATARIRAGPIGLTPSGTLTNMGIDSNVFNDAVDPRRDFTFTLSPQVDVWMRAWRSRAQVTGRADLLYYRRYASQRSLDGTIAVRFEVPANRVTPWVAAGVTRGRQRLGYEIDLRSGRTTTSGSGGVEIRVGAKGAIEASISRDTLRYGSELFLGTSLRETLDRRTDTASFAYRYSPTVLTTVVLEGDLLRDRFEFLNERNADSVRLLAGFDLDESALVGGAVRVGYRKLTGQGNGLPEYSGLVTSFSTAFSVRGRTRFSLSGDRDVEYSFERLTPYYVITGGTLAVTPRLTPRWDVELSAGGQRLAYRSLVGSDAADRVDRVVQFGAGVGYHMIGAVRLGFNVSRQRRNSPIPGREYEGYRIGSSVSYGP
jgi:hypothetical protein